jgi:tetratricopeptide (TPR) repeat protein
MLRLAVFFVVTLIVLQLLRHVPVIGAIFHVPILGFWGSAILVALVASKLGDALVRRRIRKRRTAALGHVDTPHNQGKLGALLLASGDARAALAPLERAVQGEPEVLEWRYRLGQALLQKGDVLAAIEALRGVVARNPEFAYGAAQLMLASALTRAGHEEDALGALEEFERNHGPSPESAFRRGALLKAAGRRAEARAAFDSVVELSRRSVRFQKNRAAWWGLRARLARLT